MSTSKYSTEPSKSSSDDLARLRSYAPGINREISILRDSIDDLERRLIAHIDTEIERVEATLAYQALLIDQVQS